MLSACSGSGGPSWLSEEGWLAARCAAAAETMVLQGDASPEVAGQAEHWRQTADAFASTTDQGQEMREKADAVFASSMDRARTAREFLDGNCDAAALSDVRGKM
jgi:hypothetical protein